MKVSEACGFYPDRKPLCVARLRGWGVKNNVHLKVLHHRYAETEAGFVVRRGCVDDIVEAALKLLTNSSLSQSMGTMARDIAEAKYTVSRTTDKIERIYFELIGDHVY